MKQQPQEFLNILMCEKHVQILEIAEYFYVLQNMEVPLLLVFVIPKVTKTVSVYQHSQCACKLNKCNQAMQDLIQACCMFSEDDLLEDSLPFVIVSLSACWCMPSLDPIPNI